MAPLCPILAGYRLVVLGPCACFPFRYVQESACCSCVCRDLETLCLHFLALHVGFFFGFLLHSGAGLRMMMGLTFLWPTFDFSLLPATLNCYSCRNNLILLDLFLGQPFIPFLSGLLWALFCFYSWAPMSLRTFPLGIHGPIAFFGLPRPVC